MLDKHHGAVKKPQDKVVPATLVSTVMSKLFQSNPVVYLDALFDELAQHQSDNRGGKDVRQEDEDTVTYDAADQLTGMLHLLEL